MSDMSDKSKRVLSVISLICGAVAFFYCADYWWANVPAGVGAWVWLMIWSGLAVLNSIGQLLKQ